MAGEPSSADSPQKRTRLRRIRSFIIIFLAVAVTVLVATYGIAMQAGWLHKPYSSAVKPLAWILGHHENAYNFDDVIPGHCYRSGMPDERLLRHISSTYGISHIVSLKGERECHGTARELGMEVTTMTWGTDRVPPESELLKVLSIIQKGGPVLIHCSVGKHRTGYAIAAYRILRQDWTFEQAFQEMIDHGYMHDDRPVFEESLQAFFINN